MKKIRLNTNALKYIAIFAMLLDHIAWAFLPLKNPIGYAFHFIGRITAPIMCFFIAQGYELTSNRTKYATRLLVFAIISQFPWWLFHEGSMNQYALNMIFTLFVCFVAVTCEDKIKNHILRSIAIFVLCFVTVYTDWLIFAVLFSVYFYRYRDNAKKRAFAFSFVALLYFVYSFSLYDVAYDSMSTGVVMAIYTLGVFLALPLISCYDRDKPFSKKSKWVFYIFYPAHLLVLAIIKMFL